MNSEVTNSRRQAPSELSCEEIESQFRYASAVAEIHARNGRTDGNAPLCELVGGLRPGKTRAQYGNRLAHSLFSPAASVSSVSTR